MTSTRSDANPFVGPRAFLYGEALYGRSREVQKLLDLVMAERIVLMYSPSGAGKTSLIQAALLPRLMEEDFFVLPSPASAPANAPQLLRVSHRPASDVEVPPDANPYILSLMLCLEESLPAEKKTAVPQLARLDFSSYLKRYAEVTGCGRYRFFAIDQFEEIVTINPTDREGKLEFFRQLGVTLQDRDVWGLFAMREEFIAALDPYVNQIPTQLKMTFRLDLLDQEAAKLAMQTPAMNAGVDFKADAAQKLVDDLRIVRLPGESGKTEEKLGLYVEPVQLQVVCRRLWEMLPAGESEINLTKVEAVGDVDAALSDYYTDKVHDVAATTGVSERKIRHWVDTALITPLGIRTQVLQAPEESAGLSNEAIAELEDTHLVRAEKRRSVIWYELAHDRLILPIRENNRLWFQKHLNVLQRQAQLWDSQKRDPGMLLTGAALVEAEKWAQTPGMDLNDTERDFLAECAQARTEALKEKKVNDRFRIATILAVSLCVALVAVLVFAFHLKDVAEANEAEAKNQKNEADKQRKKAVKEQEKAEKALKQADDERKKALKALAQADEEREKAEKALFDTKVAWAAADEAKKLAVMQRIEANRQKAVAESEKNEANRQATIALSRQLAAQSGSRMQENPDQALLLSLEAKQINDNPQSRGSVLSTLSRSSQLKKFLRYHTERANRVAYSPDGKMLASAGNDGRVVIWNPSSDHPGGLPLKGHEGRAVTAIAFSRDGAQLASGDSEGTVMIRDLKHGTSSKIADAHKGAIAHLSFDSTRHTVLSTGHDDSMVRSWKLKDVDPEPEESLSFPHPHPIYSTAISPDRRLIAVGDFVEEENKGTVTIYNASTRDRLGGPFYAHETPVYHLAFSRDGKRLATCGGMSFVIWDISTPSAPAPVTRAFTGHTNTVLSVDFNKDGTKVVSSSADRSVRLWDVQTGQQTANLLGHDGPVMFAAFSPDGEEIASAGDDGSVILWSSTPQQRLASPTKPHPAAVLGVALSPDGQTVVSAGKDGKISVWDAVNHRMRGTPFPGHDPGVKAMLTSVAFNASGNKFVTGSNDSTVRVWDTASGVLIKGPYRDESAVWSVAFHPKRDVVASGNAEGIIRLWDNGTGRQLGPDLTGHVGPVMGLAFSADGSILASASADRSVRLWDTRSAKPLGKPLLKHEEAVYAVAFMHDSTTLASGSIDGRIYLWDAAATNPQPEPFAPQDGWIYRLSFSGNDKLLASGGAALKLWDVEKKEEIPTAADKQASSVVCADFGGRDDLLATGGGNGATLLWNTARREPEGPEMHGHFSAVKSLAVSEGGSRVAVGYEDGTILAYDIGTGRRFSIENFRHEGEVTDLAFMAGGKVLFSASREDGTVTLWDVDGGGSSGRIPREGVDGIVLSPGGQFVGAWDSSGSVELINLATNKMTSIAGHASPDKLRSMTFNSSGTILATAGLRDVILWDTDTGEELGTIRDADRYRSLYKVAIEDAANYGGLYKVAFDPAGTVLATGGKDTMIRLYDVTDPLHPVHSGTLKGHGGTVLGLSFSPNGKLLASGSFDQTVRLWDVDSRQQIGPTLKKHNGAIEALAFADNGRVLMSGGDDGVMVSWELDEAWLHGTVCGLTNRNLTPEERKLYGMERRSPVCFEDALTSADHFAVEDRPQEARKEFEEAVTRALAHDDLLFRESVCWRGAIDGFPEVVMPACDKALESAREVDQGPALDSRGIARAVSGNYQGAISDFRAFLSWADDHPELNTRNTRQRAKWVESLQAGKNPFDKQTLEQLRME